MKKNKFRLPQKVTPDRVKQFAFSLNLPSPRYKKKDGTSTLDVSEAVLDPFGKPVQVGYDSSALIPNPKPTVLCLDPSDPTARLRALEARQRLNDCTLLPTIYEDSIDAAHRANSIANKVIEKLNSYSDSHE